MKQINITFIGSTLPKMDDLLQYMTKELPAPLVASIDFIITFNPFGAYYNLLIRTHYYENDFERKVRKVIKEWKEKEDYGTR